MLRIVAKLQSTQCDNNAPHMDLRFVQEVIIHLCFKKWSFKKILYLKSRVLHCPTLDGWLIFQQVHYSPTYIALIAFLSI